MSNEVQTDTGRVRGEQRADHLVFQGIPYAAKPVRWAPPQRAERWEDTRDATRPGSPCPQVGSSYSDTRSTNEDCLSVNVTTPDTEGRKPVMVWVHGDGAVGAGHFFDAGRLAAQGDVVVVTFNYRMGVFGGFGLPGLPHSGEFGLLDQRAALEWVRRNAEAFGGDPGNVTLFGVSFGATATAAHLIAPEPLFHKAIMHSAFTLVDVPKGAWYPGLEALHWLAWRSVPEIQEIGGVIAKELGCADVECLRQLPTEKLLDVPQVMNVFQPFGYREKTPAASLEAGEFANVPVLAGATRDEHNSFVALFRELAGQPVTAEQYPRLLADAFGEHAAAIEAEYPLSDFAGPAAAWATVLTDRMWARSTFRAHELLSAKNTVYAYEFADRKAPPSPGFPEALQGANHSADIDYLFRDQEFEKVTSPRQKALSDQMIRYWTNFARTGDPNGDGLPAWQPFNDGEHVQSLAPDAVQGVDYAAEHRLKFWNDLVA